MLLLPHILLIRGYLTAGAALSSNAASSEHPLDAAIAVSAVLSCHLLGFAGSFQLLLFFLLLVLPMIPQQIQYIEPMLI